MLFHKKSAKLLVTMVFLSVIVMASSFSNAETSNKFCMSYIYFGNSSNYNYYVDRTNNSLDEISPDYFGINDDGSLYLTPAVSKEFVDGMHARGIKVVPFLSNEWDRAKGRKALANADTYIAGLAEVVSTYNLDGVNIDIENLTEEDRDAHTEFVRKVNAALGEDKTVSIAVPANPSGSTIGWCGSYDYKALGNYCDYLLLMAYDEHYQGSLPGPVASFPFVEKSIKSALQSVAKEKLVLGIPFYGRYWNNSKSYGGYGINDSTIDSLIKKYGGSVYFDTAEGSAKAAIKIPAGNEPIISGKKLDPGTYTIWYDNETAIKMKLQLVQKYGLKGVGSWSLGQELPETWNYYSLWLNGSYFSDIQGHWAGDAIMSMQEKGWMIGSGALFYPDSPLTRAQAATLLVRALGYTDWTGGYTFKDISGHWAQKEIETAAQHGMVEGTGNGMFSPDRPITREEIAAMLDRCVVLQQPGSTGASFIDISPSMWSYNYIVDLANSGLVEGYPDGGFHPVAPITRAEMAELMNRAAGDKQTLTAKM